MEFKQLAMEYFMVFDTQPPILTTLDTNNEEYLKMLEKAIRTKKPFTRDDLADVFMTDHSVVY